MNNLGPALAIIIVASVAGWLVASKVNKKIFYRFQFTINFK